MTRSIALASAGLLLAFAAAGCGDPAAKAKAEAEAKAKAEAATATRDLKSRTSNSVRCLNALRWREAKLSRAGIGPVKLYTDYYRAELEKQLGDRTLPAEGAAPALSKAGAELYLEWSYGEDVKKFEGENGRGPTIILGCIQFVAERGKIGPLADLTLNERMLRMQSLRGQLK